MFQKLTCGSTPSLNALRAFEAVARTGKVTLAADELCVTPSAVSRCKVRDNHPGVCVSVTV